jgi:hypothetical protein
MSITRSKQWKKFSLFTSCWKGSSRQRGEGSEKPSYRKSGSHVCGALGRAVAFPRPCYAPRGVASGV